MNPMQKRIYLLLSMWILPFGLSGQWQIVHENKPWLNHASDMVYLTKDMWMYVTSSDSNKFTTFKTNDAGNNWESYASEIKCAEPIQLGSYSFLNDTAGWFTSNAGLFSTGDGGRSWVMLNDSNWLGWSIHVRSRNCIYLGGPELYRSVDGGLSVKKISPLAGFGYGSACFSHSDTCIVYSGNVIMQTLDGGQTWDKKSLEIGQKINNLKFINDSAGYFIASGDGTGYRLFKTNDLFRNWTLAYSTDYPLESCVFFNKDDGLAVFNMKDSTWLMTSTDGGITWDKVDFMNFLHNWRYSLFLIGAKSVVIYGQLWDVSVNSFTKIENMSINWGSMQFSHPSLTGIYIDNYSNVLVSGDDLGPHLYSVDIFKGYYSGTLWRSHSSGLNAESCKIFNNGHGFGTARGFKEVRLYETWDAGETWNEIDHLPGFEPGYRVILIVNEDTWFVQQMSGIYYTGNGGISWSNIFNIGESTYGIGNSMYFHSAQKGIVAGESGHILKYDQEQGWTEIPINSTLPLNKFIFSDTAHGWVTGGFIDRGAEQFSPLLLKSSDGGYTWSDVTLPHYFIRDLYFKDSLNGWAVGENADGRGFIIYSDDGGRSWLRQLDSLNAPINAISYKSGMVWAVGGNGLILKMIDTAYVADTNNAIKVALVEFPSIQVKNYPNPFLISTSISYQLSNISDVELNIYDMLGVKVTRLVQERKTAGNYQVEWNASGMKPGIYFCELKSGPVRVVKKMILVK
jgi:photosystem II stability/assembly factor-like uncharacterized protein